MDVVKVFNSELAGLYECKPPISKAKMTAITKAAVRAIKFYKHVVQSVEKFLQKCKTEYKIPGLYVIDSIVRQSRHQFSTEKDVFAPRFARNILVTFFYIFKCPVEDKSKVIRVLNLWQKNHVFGEEIIQPLFDLADPSHPIQKEIGSQIAQKGNKTKSQPQQVASQSAQQHQQTHHLTPQQQQTPTYQRTPQTPQQQNALSQASNLLSQSSNINSIANSMNLSASLANQVTTLDPNLLHQIQQMLMKTEDASAVTALGNLHQTSFSAVPPSVPSLTTSISSLQHASHPAGVMSSMLDNKATNVSGDFDGRTLPFMSVDTSQPPPGYSQGFNNPSLVLGIPSTNDYSQQPVVQSPREEGERSDDSEDNKENQDERETDRHKRSRSRSYSRSKRSRRRSRSSSRSRHKRSRSRGRRSRSRDKDRDRRDRDRGGRRRDRDRVDHEKEQEREKEREKERERKKRGLPPMKENHLSVCSTTLWVGHLSKLVHQEELSDTFGEYGDIVSIDLIPPRGCAFICMNRRQDSSRALLKLKDHKIHNKSITIAWAPGRGVKGKEFKDYWEVDVGCSYIPYSKLSKMSRLDLDSLEEGGMIDEETVPSWMTGRIGATNALPNVNQPPPTLQPPPPQMILPNLMIQPPTSAPDRHGLQPQIDKDVRRDNPSMGVPPIMPPFGIPNIPPPGPGGLQMGGPMMPHLGVPPPMTTLSMPPVSSMLGQPLIRMPPNLTMAPVSISSQDSDSAMDVEMEDAEKSDSQNDTRDSLDDTSNKAEMGRIDFPGSEQFNAFTAGALQRPPGFGQFGMMARAAPNFGPRGLPNMSGFNNPRGLLAPPPMMGDPRGMRPMGPMLGTPMPRGMMINRFSRFPRFGVISDLPRMNIPTNEPPPQLHQEPPPSHRQEPPPPSHRQEPPPPLRQEPPPPLHEPPPQRQEHPLQARQWGPPKPFERKERSRWSDVETKEEVIDAPSLSNGASRNLDPSIDQQMKCNERFADRNRFKEDDRNMYTEDDRNRYKDRNTFKDEDRNRYRDNNRSRSRDDDRNRYKDDDRNRFKDDDRNRFKDDDRNRFNDDDRNRFKNDDKGRDWDRDCNRDWDRDNNWRGRGRGRPERDFGGRFREREDRYPDREHNRPWEKWGDEREEKRRRTNNEETGSGDHYEWNSWSKPRDARQSPHRDSKIKPTSPTHQSLRTSSYSDNKNRVSSPKEEPVSDPQKSNEGESSNIIDNQNIVDENKESMASEIPSHLSENFKAEADKDPSDSVKLTTEFTKPVSELDDLSSSGKGFNEPSISEFQIFKETSHKTFENNLDRSVSESDIDKSSLSKNEQSNTADSLAEGSDEGAETNSQSGSLDLKKVNPGPLAEDEAAQDSFAPESVSRYSLAPESISQNSFAPEPVSRDSFAPESVSQDSFAPESVSRDSFAPESVSRDSFAPHSLSHESFVPDQAADELLTADSVASESLGFSTIPDETSSLPVQSSARVVSPSYEDMTFPNESSDLPPVSLGDKTEPTLNFPTPAPEEEERNVASPTGGSGSVDGTIQSTNGLTFPSFESGENTSPRASFGEDILKLSREEPYSRDLQSPSSESVNPEEAEVRQQREVSSSPFEPREDSLDDASRNERENSPDNEPNEDSACELPTSAHDENVEESL